jgi:hypothetical protein
MLNVVVTMEKDWKREEREGLCEVFLGEGGREEGRLHERFKKK